MWILKNLKLVSVLKIYFLKVFDIVLANSVLHVGSTVPAIFKKFGRLLYGEMTVFHCHLQQKISSTNSHQTLAHLS